MNLRSLSQIFRWHSCEGWILIQSGFTLIELLVVVAIIGILTAIAIPQYSSFRVRTYDSAAKADLRGIIASQEAYFADGMRYASSMQTLIGTTRFSPQTSVEMGGSVTTWEAKVFHFGGSKTYCFDSSSSHSIEEVSGIDASCP